ncbi:tachykinin-3 [Ambystoma mexicanum]|uniref:tachykinin-3 n=1 Tax=Ambystoma mexicanum TaxID=8296 RepID=UPI0037E8DAA9
MMGNSGMLLAILVLTIAKACQAYYDEPEEPQSSGILLKKNTALYKLAPSNSKRFSSESSSEDFAELAGRRKTEPMEPFPQRMSPALLRRLSEGEYPSDRFYGMMARRNTGDMHDFFVGLMGKRNLEPDLTNGDKDMMPGKMRFQRTV